MIEPTVLPRNFLDGMRIGISVSESADLGRLGLTPLHCELGIAELARAIFVAGGTVVYGGRLIDPGYTKVFLDELQSYRDDRDALILCVPESEWRRLSRDELRRRRDELQISAQLICVDGIGQPVDIDDVADDGALAVTPTDVALTAMRVFATGLCDARVVAGGRLEGFQGTLPGVMEEALLAFKASQPLYVAGGFGGAAAALALRLGIAPREAFPSEAFVGIDEASKLLKVGEEIVDFATRPHDGLDDGERSQLATTYRPGDIASIVLTGLGRTRGIDT